MKCYVVEDLLPEYVENLCSSETKQEIEKHLRDCDSCRRKWEEIQGENRGVHEKAAIGSEDIQPFRKIKRELKNNRIKKVAAIVVLIVVCGVFGVLTIGQFFPYLSCPSYDSLMYRYQAKQIARQFVEGDMEKVLEGMSTSLDFTNLGDAHDVFFRDVAEHLKEIHQKVFRGKESKIRVDGVIYEDRYGMEVEDKEFCYQVNLVITVGDRDIFMRIAFDNKYSYSLGLDMGENMNINANKNGEDSLEYQVRDMQSYLRYYSETCMGFSIYRRITNGRVNVRNYENITEEDKNSTSLSYYFVEDCSKEPLLNMETGCTDYSLKVGNGFYEILRQCKSNDFQLTNKEYNPEKKKYSATLYWQITDLNDKKCIMSKEFYYGMSGYEAVDDTETIYADDGFEQEIVEQLKNIFD